MSDTVTVSRTDLGRVHLTVTDDWENLVTYYQVKAPRVSGTVTAAWRMPALGRRDRRGGTGFDPDGATVLLWYGRDPETGRPQPPDRDLLAQMARDARRSPVDPLTVNRVTLRGGSSFSPRDLRQRGDLPLWEVTADAPYATRERTRAVLTLIARHWLSRDPHTHVMRLAAARRLADDWAALCAERITEAADAIAHARYLIAEAEDDAADAARLKAAPPAAPITN
jgi:hypothetical protein